MLYIEIEVFSPFLKEKNKKTFLFLDKVVKIKKFFLLFLLNFLQELLSLCIITSYVILI